MTDTPRTIFVSVFHSFISKNILNTNAIKELRDPAVDQVVLLVPESKRKFFERHYSDDFVTIVGIDIDHILSSKIRTVLRTVSRLLIDTHYLRYKRKEVLDNRKTVLGWLRYIFYEGVVRLLAGRRFVQNIFRHMDAHLSRRNCFVEVLSTYNPTVIFATDIFDPLDQQLLREAKTTKIKTVGMVRSWDNCYSKGLLGVVPDVSLVNNKVIQDELATIHHVPINSIRVVGLPQFDAFTEFKPENRENFFARFGLDPNKKLILFAPAGNILSDTDADICDILLRARERGDIPTDTQVFVRNHPHHPAELKDFQESVDGFVVQTPGDVLDTSDKKETELTPDDQVILKNLVAHADVLLWVATSLCLDALVYDVPEIVLNFDGYQKKDYYQSVRRYHDEEHMKKMFKLKPFRVANNEEELTKYIKMYLDDRDIDRENRDEVKKQQLFKLDGEAGRRIAAVLKKEVSRDNVA